MDSQNQNQPQTQQPNFDFIMNQPGPDGTEPAKQKKFSKKIVFLSILTVFTIVMVAVLVLVPSPTDKQLANNSSTGNELPSTISDTFLQNIQQSKTYNDNKPNMTTSLQAVITDENMYNFAVGRVIEAIDVTTCQKASNADTGSEYECKKTDAEQTAKLYISTASDNDGTVRVSSITVGTEQ